MNVIIFEIDLLASYELQAYPFIVLNYTKEDKDSGNFVKFIDLS